jgi:hypothetical protein
MTAMRLGDDPNLGRSNRRTKIGVIFPYSSIPAGKQPHLTSQRTAFAVFYNNSRDRPFLKVVQK